MYVIAGIQDSSPSGVPDPDSLIDLFIDWFISLFLRIIMSSQWVQG